MKNYKYPLATATWDQSEIQAMLEVISRGQFTMGEYVRRFEDRFSKAFSSSHGVMSNSGSSANLLAIAAIRYSSFRPQEGRDEVIVPAVSWSTTFYPVTQLGFKLKFVDVDLGTLNATAESIESAMDEKTAGVVAVNLLGNPSELAQIRDLCDAKGTFMIEDNCESMGAEVQGRFAGTYGHIGTFSSFFSHHISTMEGGMALTESLELAEAMTSLRAHGWTRELPDSNTVFSKSGSDFDDLFRFVLPGYNLRPIELEGAIGLRQLEKLQGLLQGRRENALRFRKLAERFPGIKIQEENGKSSWFGFSMILSGPFEGQRPRLVNTLERFGIACRPIVAGNFTRNPVMKHLPHVSLPKLPNADKVHVDGLFVGNHHYDLTMEFDLLESALQEFCLRR